MKKVNVYLTFDGNCEEAFKFYQTVFGGEFASISRFSEMPADENFPVPESHKDRIMHVTLPIGEGTVLMGSDTAGGQGTKLQKGNNFSLSVNTDDREAAEKVFQMLAKEGQVTMPMAETFWGSYFGMLTDKFGIQWMVSFDTGQG